MIVEKTEEVCRTQTYARSELSTRALLFRHD
jgi:hypothetical protein